MQIALTLIKAVFSFLYSVCKLVPTNGCKVLFLSRQSNKLSIDFRLLQSELKTVAPEVKIVAICCKYSCAKELPRFIVASLRSIYHLATSKVCVLDAYWPLVSILKHKNNLTIIQMWHSLGKVKKSGYQTLGSSYGRKTSLAKQMNMHQNYDYIIAGGQGWNAFYCESFNVAETTLVNVGLPRIDYLLNTKEVNKSRFFDVYGDLAKKEIILYAPTFRKGIDPKPYVEELVNSIDFSRYALLLKAHPNQGITINNPSVMTCDNFETMELLAVCDYLITDYSAIAIEAAVLDIKTYYYLYDYDDYVEKNGINIDLLTLMRNCTFKNAKDLIESITSKDYPYEELNRYKTMYLPQELGTSTKKIASLIVAHLSF